MQSFLYPATLMPQDEGGFVVKFLDMPEATTQGEDVEDALREAADCLEEAVANRIAMGLPIPNPSPLTKDCHPVTLPAQMALKAALYTTMGQTGISKVELARRLHCDEKEVRRLLDPRHPSKLPRIEAALAAVGQKLVIGFEVAV